MAVFALLLASIAVSFAYFSANLTGQETGTTITVVGGSMNIIFADNNPNIEASNVIPGWSATKTFTVTGNNTTDLSMPYTLTLVVENNSFTSEAITYTLTSTNTSSSGTEVTSIATSVGLPRGTSEELLGSGSFVKGTGKVHTYELNISFADKPDVNQNENQGKAFKAHVKIEGENASNNLYCDNPENASALQCTILADNGGKLAIAAKGEPDFDKVVPGMKTVTQKVEVLESASVISGTTGKILGTNYTFNNVTGEYTLTGVTNNQNYNSASIGKYTCNDSSTATGDKCYDMYKIIEAGEQYTEATGTTYTSKINSAANRAVSSAYTFDGTYYQLTSPVTNVTYNSGHVGMYTCGTTTSTGINCTSLYLINEVNGSNEIINAIRYTISLSYHVTKAEYYSVMDDPTETNSGMYAAMDDYGISYYFRGHRDQINNNVLFGGYQWKIIRINGDGTIRLIYNGTEEQWLNASAMNTNSPNTGVANTSFNTFQVDANYVGYTTIGTNGPSPKISTSYQEATTGTFASTAKTQVDYWYQNNLLTKDSGKWHDMVATNMFCNDRSLAPGYSPETSGYGNNNETYYSGFTRLTTNKSPNLKCPNISRDGYAVSTALMGNGKLTYPAGLITADEVVLAGGSTSEIPNPYSYLSSGRLYLTMTPFAVFLNNASSAMYAKVYLVRPGGHMAAFVDSSVNTYADVRPVISLKKDVLIASGDGSSASPFVIE